MSLITWRDFASWYICPSSRPFLAHLSRRLTSELIGYPWSGVRPSSVHLSVHIFKHLLLQNHLGNQSQILYGASLGRGNESLFAASGHMTKMAATPIYVKILQKSSPELAGRFPRNLLLPIMVCSNNDPGVTLTYFTARSNLVT